MRDLDFSLDDIPLIEFTEHAEAAVNFSHPLLARLPIPEGCRVAEQCRPAHVSTADGWVRFRGGMEYDGKKALDQRVYQEFWRWGDVNGLELEEGPPPPEMLSGLGFFAEVFDRLLQNCCRMFEEALTVCSVPASRTTPLPQELSFLFSGNTDKPDNEHANFHISMHGDQVYRRLAWSFQVNWRKTVGSLTSQSAINAERFHQRVNRILTEHLFQEYGYQLKADYRILMTPELFDRLRIAGTGTEDEVIRDLSLMISIRLEDPLGRQHAFTEVGSGLGYVLPVLAAACDESWPVVVLQQPELHLHPALQGQLGDVFVELAEGSRRLIVETHSEHLLLRVLKRLRQSGNATNINPELHVEPDDVVILYFDPQTNGTTKVKRLRVSVDGEFMDRWPRGFFTERDEELFDE